MESPKYSFEWEYATDDGPKCPRCEGTVWGYSCERTGGPSLLIGMCLCCREYETRQFQLDVERYGHVAAADPKIGEVRATHESLKYWAYGNGSPGCLYDHASGPFDSAEEAVSSAVELLELSESEAAELTADHILYLKGDRAAAVGAGMVEVFEVDANWSCD